MTHSETILKTYNELECQFLFELGLRRAPHEVFQTTGVPRQIPAVLEFSRKYLQYSEYHMKFELTKLMSASD